MKNLFMRYIYASPNVLDIEYFKTPASIMGVELVRSLNSFFTKTLSQQLYKNGMPKKGLHAALSTTK